MIVVFALIGGVVGLMFWSSGGFFGFLVGAAIAVLGQQLMRAREQIRDVQAEIEGLRLLDRVRSRESAPMAELPTVRPAAVAPMAATNSAPAAPAVAAALVTPAEPVVSANPPSLPAADVPAFKRAVPPERPRQAVPPPRPRPAAAVSPAEPGQGNALVEFFTGGNWPVKIGVLLLFAGVAALLKYAIENELLVLPIELRLLGIAVLGVLAVGFGYRSRTERRTFGLSMQGLGLGVVALTTYAAFARFGLLSTEITLAIVIVCIGVAVALALLEDALALAWFATFGAFLAPWIAQVADAPAALFGYYLVVNIGVLLIALKKDWRSLNLLAFFATFIVGSVWGAQFYQPQWLSVTEPFLLLNGVLFAFIAYWFAQRAPEDGLRRIETVLVFGVPVSVLLLLGLMLTDQPEALGLRAFGIGVLYALASYWLHSRQQLPILKRCYTALAAAFVTLAIPLCFSAPTTAMMFALQSLALMWLAVHVGKSRLLRYASALLYALAVPAYFIGFGWNEGAIVILNGPGFGALALTVAGFGNAWLLFSAIRSIRRVPGTARFAAIVFFTLGALALQGGGLAQIEHFGEMPGRLWQLLLLATIGTVLGSAFFYVLRWPLARRLLELNVPLALITLLVIWAETLPAFGQWLGLGWVIYLAAVVMGLRQRASEDGVMVTLLRWSVPLLATALLTTELVRKSGLWEIGESFTFALLCAPLLLLLASIVAAPRWLDRLYGRDDRGDESSRGLALSLSIGALMLAFVGCFLSGDAHPLRFIPLLNPLELTIIIAIALSALALRSRLDANALRMLCVVLGFIAISAAALRWTHQLFGEPWGAGLMASMRAQSALSMLWTLAGVSGMLLGARNGWRRPWQLGAAVMVLVLLKLAVIDRQFLGDLPGIVAFLVVGGLLVVVGYFAPQPPAEQKD